jgi:hypothetical protein
LSWFFVFLLLCFEYLASRVFFHSGGHDGYHSCIALHRIAFGGISCIVPGVIRGPEHLGVFFFLPKNREITWLFLFTNKNQPENISYRDKGDCRVCLLLHVKLCNCGGRFFPSFTVLFWLISVCLKDHCSAVCSTRIGLAASGCRWGVEGDDRLEASVRNGEHLLASIMRKETQWEAKGNYQRTNIMTFVFFNH